MTHQLAKEPQVPSGCGPTSTPLGQSNAAPSVRCAAARRRGTFGRNCAALLGVLLLASCGGGNGVTPPTDSGVTAVVVTPGTLSIKTGETAQLTALVSAGSGVSTAVVWSTKNPAVATVNPSGLVTGVTPGSVAIVAGAVADSRKTTTVSVTVTQATHTLTVMVGPGVLAVPDTGVRAYPGNAEVPYQFQLKPGFENLLVRRDTTTVPSTGTVTVDRDLRLMAFADTTIPVAPADQATLVQPLRQMLTSANPLPGYFAMQAAAENLYATLPRDEAARRVAAAFNAAFEPERDAQALRLALVKIVDSLQKGGSSATLREPPVARATAGRVDALPVTFLFSNGVFTPADDPALTIKYYLTPTIIRAGFSNPVVESVLNRSGIDDGSGAISTWICLMAVNANVPLASSAFDCLASYKWITALSDLRESAVQYFVLPSSSMVDDTRRLADKIRAEHARGNAVVVIAHSQGNLVTQEALDALLNERSPAFQPACVGVVSIAPPRRIGWSDQVTDMIIRDGFAQDILSLLFIADAATPSVNNSLSGSYRLGSMVWPMNWIMGSRLHLLQASYLGRAETEAVIIGGLQAQVGKLTSGCMALTPAQIYVTSNVATTWTIAPGALSGSGQVGSYSVRPGENGMTYTITPGALPGRTVSISSSDGPSPTMRLAPGEAKTFTLIYSSVAQPPAIGLSPSALTFGVAGGAALPVAQTVAVSNSGGGSLIGLGLGPVAYSEGSGWLGTPTLNSSSAPAILTVRPVTSDLAAGTYHATIPVVGVAGAASGTVTVSYTISATPLLPPPTLQAPTDGAVGGATTPTFSWSAVAGANRYWLMISSSPTGFPTDPSASTCPGCLMAGFTGATTHTLPNAFPNGGSAIVGLNGGATYYWKVQAFNDGVAPGIQGQFSATSSFTTAGAAAPSIALDRTTVPFTYTVGGALPSSQAVNITNGGSGTLDGLSLGSVGYAPGQPTGWLNTALITNTAPTSLSVVVSPAPLPQGSYAATVQLFSTASGLVGGPRTVTVTLTVNGVGVAQFSQQGPKLVGMGAAGPASQGQSVALSADGNTAIIGGPVDNGFTGAAWVWTRTGGVWAQQGPKLVGSGAVATAAQGHSVSISADGNTAIVGGYADNDGVGAAWIWTRSGGVWTQQGSKLVGAGAVSGRAQQGYSVSLAADGNTAVVGGTIDNGDVGAVWVWTRSGGVWTQQGPKLVGAGAVGESYQGHSVSVSADGNTAIVGGPGSTFGGNGAAWVWVRNSGVWTQQGPKLVGLDVIANGQPGLRVSLSADGNTAVIGRHGDNNFAGAAWVWTRSGGVWTQQGTKLVGSGASATGQQGSSVSLSADGNTLLVGGFGDNLQFGASWVWTRSGGVWTQEGGKLVGSGASGLALQGSSVAVAADGSTAIVGGSSDDASTGAAWIFFRNVGGSLRLSGVRRR